MEELDSQQVEILGRSALKAAIVGDGLEVASPERDSGIDLLAFQTDPWQVVPIQMKAATNAVFSVHRKYEKVPGLVMVYVWNARNAQDLVMYGMRWTDARDIAEQLGWTATESWKRDGYGTNRPSKRVREAIDPYRITPGSWQAFFK